jgi:hypothetical protein
VAVRDLIAEYGRRIVPLLQRRVLDELTDAAPKRTGALARSVRVSGDSTPQTVTINVETDVEYAGWMDTGTRPHPIVGNPYLAFYWEKIGRFVVLRRVSHPGTPRTGWWTDTLARWPEMAREVAGSIGDVGPL